MYADYNNFNDIYNWIAHCIDPRKTYLAASTLTTLECFGIKYRAGFLYPKRDLLSKFKHIKFNRTFFEAEIEKGILTIQGINLLITICNLFDAPINNVELPLERWQDMILKNLKTKIEGRDT